MLHNEIFYPKWTYNLLLLIASVHITKLYSDVSMHSRFSFLVDLLFINKRGDFVLMQALDKCRESPPMDWPAAAYVLLGREDLAFSRLAYSRKSVELEPHINVNMTCMSTPYMLNLHPVTIPSSISDTIESDDNKLEDVDSVEGSVADGMEHIFNSGIQLRYGRDLRLNEVGLLILRITEIDVSRHCFPLKYNLATLIGAIHELTDERVILTLNWVAIQ